MFAGAWSVTGNVTTREPNFNTDGGKVFYIELESPPTDTPARVKFAPKSNQLLVASWDSTLRLYDVDAMQIKSTYSFRGPVLDTAFSADGEKGFGVGVDMTVRQFDLKSEQSQVLGKHSKTVSRAVYLPAINQLVTGSWDHTLRLWDPRATKTHVLTRELPERVYDMDSVPSSSMLVVGLAGRATEIYDIRKMDAPVQKRESSLKYMTRVIASMPNGEGYASGSTEGRIAVEYFDPAPAMQSKKYAFKCHRQSQANEDKVWPVNAIAFNSASGHFASAGSDGIVAIWDYAAKKRLRQYPQYHSAVTTASFNHDGSKMAIGVGYAHDGGQGEKGGKNSVFIKNYV